MANQKLKQALRPLIAQVRKKVEGGRDVLEVKRGSQTVRIPFSSSSVDANTTDIE